MKNNNRSGFIEVAFLLAVALTVAATLGGVALSNKEKQIEAEIRDAKERIVLDNIKSTQMQLGAFRPSGYVGKLLTRLTEGGSESTFRTTPNTAPDGSSLTTAKLGDFIVITINPGAANEEKVSASAVSTSTGGVAIWTIINRGLSFTANTTSSDNIKTHAIGETVIISNDDHFLSQQYVNVDDAQTITGVKTYPSSSLPRAASTPTYGAGDELKFVTYGQLASTSFAGTVDCSTTQKGVCELATKAEFAAGTATGDTTAPLVPQNSFFNQTSSATTTGVVSKTNGKISQGFLDLTEGFIFSGGVSSTATTTLSGSNTLATTTMSATLTLQSSTPSGPNVATRKDYVDNKVVRAATTTNRTPANATATTTLNVSVPAASSTGLYLLSVLVGNGGSMQNTTTTFGINGSTFCSLGNGGSNGTDGNAIITIQLLGQTNQAFVSTIADPGTLVDCFNAIRLTSVDFANGFTFTATTTMSSGVAITSTLAYTLFP